ncbi:MAG: branched-chain amino acid ABC transporter permease [Nitrososphaerota archaeon]
MSRKIISKNINRIFIMVILLLLLLLPIFISSYYVHFLIILFIYMCLAESWNIIGGFCGQISFGHAAFFGIGAYIASLSHVYLNFPVIFAILLGGLASSFLALIIAYPFLKLRGPAFAIGTLGFTEFIKIIILNEEKYTHGAAGFENPVATYLSIPKYGWYLGTLIILLATIFASYKISRSKIGLALFSIKEDLEAAEALGINSMKYMILAFTISTFFAGLIGGIYAFYMTYIEPYSIFSSAISVGCVTMSVLGGSGTIIGPLLGAFIIQLLNEFFKSFLAQTYLIINGVILILVVLIMPEGIINGVKKFMKFKY